MYNNKMYDIAMDINGADDLAPGSVWLVGAGPGDPGLLTLLAAHALRRADAIVYDALVDSRILNLASPEAERIHAGKRGGRPSPSQADISDRLIALARDGRRVLRLKGGDPFVFGRGGEEARALARAGIPFRVVPGITAGIGAPAYAGIPATHRDIGPAVTFITGHAAGGRVPDSLDWQALARGSPTLVLYMALKTLPDIARALIDAGRPSSEPACVIAHATTPEQRVVTAPLSRIAEAAARAGLTPPAIVVIGKVVDDHESLCWFNPPTARHD